MSIPRDAEKNVPQRGRIRLRDVLLFFLIALVADAVFFVVVVGSVSSSQNGYDETVNILQAKYGATSVIFPNGIYRTTLKPNITIDNTILVTSDRKQVCTVTIRDTYSDVTAICAA